ncbi:MAG: efflux RND transporter periplasmic adaptor subunit, partial [Acidobacteriota bacterium]|nr:efflux RND transporter periplasmic adaptor subunit [Acidobacteriota bacterium]
ALGGSGAILTISKESQLLFGIRTAPVTERQIIGGLKVAGVVRARPDARAVISPPVSGRVFLDRGITIGAAVGRGERIGYVEQILGAPEQASLEGQRIQLRTAALEQQARATEQQSLAQQARTRLAQARRELQRATNLLEAGAAPRRRVEEAQTAVRLAEQEVASAEQQARIASQQVGLARDSVARVDPVRTFPLLSPVTGLITNLNVATGQQVEAGAELLNVVNLTTVFLEAQVFERDLPTVREARRASYMAAALPDEVYRIGEGGDGRLVTLGQAIDPQTRAANVIYEVPNPLNRLRDGMFVEITIDTTGNQTVLSVPKQAVITEQGRTFVFVFDGGERFERRAVTLGAEGQDYTEVRSGLQPSERVVTEGIYQLRSTQPGA